MFIKFLITLCSVTSIFANQEINDKIFDQPVGSIKYIHLSGKNAIFDVCCHDQLDQIKIFTIDDAYNKNYGIELTKDTLTIIFKPQQAVNKTLCKYGSGLPRIQINLPNRIAFNYIITNNSKVNFLNTHYGDVSLIASDQASIYYDQINCEKFSANLFDRASLDIESGFIKNFLVKLKGRSHNRIKCEVNTLLLNSENTGSMTFYKPVSNIHTINLNHDGCVYLLHPPKQTSIEKEAIKISKDTRGCVVLGQLEVHGHASRFRNAKL